MKWEAVIGLEVHAQLATASKIFSGAATQFGSAANTQACAIDLGFPGVLPVLNAAVVEMAVKLGVAIDATVAPLSVFARKNYFYPDLPKGYQISQYELPIVQNGHVMIELDDGTHKRIDVTRAHLEEDAGKSLHEDFHGMSGIDLNRAGTPLLEIVSEPQLRSAKEAVAYLKVLHALVRYLGICDGNMQEGSFRCDANVSVRPVGQEKLGVRAEIKNLNSFRFVEKAIDHEIARHIEILENGGKLVPETRLYDPDQDETRTMRSKEEANDYRYFPDPDLLPVEVTQELIAHVRKNLPELPEAKRQRFINDLNLSRYDADLLVQSRELSEFFEAVIAASGATPKIVANWVIGDFAVALHNNDISVADAPVSVAQFAQLITRIVDNTISVKIAKTVFEAMWAKEGDADSIIAARGLKQVSDTSAIEKIIDDVINANPEQVLQYQQGKEKVFSFFVGQVMRAMQGRANPAHVNDLLIKKLSNKP